MKVDEIILEGPVWDKVKNTVSSATGSAGKFYNKVFDPRSKGLKSGQKDIDKWSKQVLQQWGTIEAGLQNTIGPLDNQNNDPDIQQKYAEQLSKWLKTYFRLSNADLENYNIANDGEFNNDNILKYIKKAYAVRLSPDYLEKVSNLGGETKVDVNKPNSSTPMVGQKLIPGKTQLNLNNVDYTLAWVGPDGRVIDKNSMINTDLNIQAGIR